MPATELAAGLGRLAFGFALGLCAGSFVAALARRVPEDWRGLLTGRSACPSCGTRLGARDLVPLASYALLRGRCRHCGRSIGLYYPAVELTAALIGAVALALLPPWQGLVAAALGWWLLALALIDLRCRLLPDLLTLPLLLVGLCLAASAPLPATSLQDAMLGAAGGLGGLYLIGRGYAALRHRQGLGLGDAKLAGAAGAWLGWQALPSLLLAAALATLLAVLAMRRPVRLETAVPLGPGLAAAFFALYVWLALP